MKKGKNYINLSICNDKLYCDNKHCENNDGFGNCKFDDNEKKEKLKDIEFRKHLIEFDCCLYKLSEIDRKIAEMEEEAKAEGENT